MNSLATSKPKSNRGGARLGSGRKPAHIEADLQALMNAAWPQSQRLAVVAALHQAALGGNVQAATALLDRALGKPVERQITQNDNDTKLMISVEYADAEPYEH